MRKLKVLGLALVAVCALSALSAASASANYNIASGSGGSITGNQVTSNVFTTDVGNVTCTIVTFTGSQATETAETLTVTPKFETCKLAGQKVTVDPTEGCKFLFEKPTTTEPVGTTDANVRVCQDEEGNPKGHIVIKDTAGLGCEVTVKPQTVGHVMFTNEAAGTVLAEATVTGIHYTWTKGCPNAPKGEPGTNTNGTYTGSVRVSGEAGGKAVAIKVT